MARLVLLHGFTQSAASWDAIAARLRNRGHEVVALDAPGHGSRGDTPSDLWGSAEMLAEVGGRATWIGYSMGGRIALHVALAHPSVVDRMVLVGATAGIEDAAERDARVRADAALATEIENDELEPFLHRWLDQPLFATLTIEAAGMEARLTNTPAALAASLRLTGTGKQESLWPRLAEIAAPTLVVVGGNDAKFRAIGERLVDGLRDARLRALADRGHACHAEDPDGFVEAVHAFVT